MRMSSVDDPDFAPYGRVITGVDTKDLMDVLRSLPIGAESNYMASEPKLEALPVADFFREHVFAGMPIQMGSVTGRNSRLDCLEHHMCSEVVMDTEDVMLLLAKREDVHMTNDLQGQFGNRLQLDSQRVKAFVAPAGRVIELYNSTLHFTPCGMNATHDFRGLVVLSRGTNGEKPHTEPTSEEDLTIWARDNWTLAHKDAPQAQQGAYVGIVGENIDLA